MISNYFQFFIQPKEAFLQDILVWWYASQNEDALWWHASQNLRNEDAMKYTKKKSEKPKTRKWNIIWFSPPFSQSVSINVGKTFLQLVAKHVPRNHKLYKIFNSSTVKVSYRCMNNMSKIIKRHNKKLTLKPRDKTPKRNRRKKAQCPMEGNRQVNDVVYRCDITRPLSKKECPGLAEGEWKSRFYNHKSSFIYKIYSNKTTIPSSIWHLKSAASEIPNLKWSVLRCIPPYPNILKKFLLCLYWKTGNGYISKPEETLKQDI